MDYQKLSSKTVPENPKHNAGFFSLLTFTWLNNLLRQGNKRPLENDNLPPLLKEDKSEPLTQHLEKEWSLGCDESQQGKSQRWLKTARLCSALIRLVPTSERVLVMSLASLNAIVRILQPLFLIGMLAELMEESPAFRMWIYLYAAGVCLCTWLIAISQCHFDYRSSMVGMRMRSAILGLVYRKVSSIFTFLAQGSVCKQRMQPVL